jgi:organic radical activating enzyme
MKLKVSELFYSAQGEGRFIGVPSVFLRTFGCNFKCAGFGMPPGELSQEANDIAAKHVMIQPFAKFEDLPLVNTGCDSYASWHPDFKDLSPTIDTDKLVDQMLALTPNHKWIQDNGNDVHLVITGGEPLLGWQRTYQDLLSGPAMLDLQNITFETNGTQALNPQFRQYLLNWTLNSKLNSRAVRRTPGQLTFSVSPKLSASGEKWSEAICPDVVASYQDIGTVYLKFVVETEEHFAEVEQAVKEFRNGGFTGVVYVMPQGGVVTPYAQNRVRVADWACSKGYYYSPRLHVDLWGNGWGK